MREEDPRQKEPIESLLFSCYVMSDSATPWTAACHASHYPPLSSRVYSEPCPLSQSYYLTISSSAAPFDSVFPSTGVLSNELTLCIRWLKYWSFSNTPSNDYSGLVSFRKYIQHYNLKLSILWHSAFSVDQLSHLSYADCVCAYAQSCLTLCNPMDCSLPWDFLSKSTGVDCHFFLQGIFLTQGSIHCLQCLLH